MLSILQEPRHSFQQKITKALFAKTREYQVPFTIHAGEAGGAAEVACAIEMGASRIGHGVRSYEDPAVVRMIREKGIFLEMCPTKQPDYQGDPGI